MKGLVKLCGFLVIGVQLQASLLTLAGVGSGGPGTPPIPLMAGGCVGIIDTGTASATASMPGCQLSPSSAGATADASASAGYGAVSATVGASGEDASAEANASFSDIITFHGVTGAAFLRYQVDITADVWEVDAAEAWALGDGVSLFVPVPGSGDRAIAYSNVFTYESSSPIAFGTPIPLGLSISLYADATQGMGYGTMSMGICSMELIALDGSPIAGLSYSSEGTYDYAGTHIPEPGTTGLTTLGGVILLLFRNRKP